MINTDPHNQRKKGLIPAPTLQRETMWVHPDIVKSKQWTTVTGRKSKGKARASSSNVVSISTRETKEDVAFLTSSETRSPPLLLTWAHLTHKDLIRQAVPEAVWRAGSKLSTTS